MSINLNQGTDTQTPSTGNITVAGGLILPKTISTGIKVDTGTPTFGWRDLLGPITIKGSGASDPTWAVYNGNVSQYQMSVNDEVTVAFHLPHDYVPATDIYAHVHWSLNVGSITENCTWEFTSIYAKGHNQAAFTTTPLVTSILQASSTTQYQHMIAETAISSAGGSGTLFDNALFEVDGLIIIRIKLSVNSGATKPFIHMVDLHYQSTNMATKNKAPNFYS